MKTYYIYIMASKSGTLYIGMTDNLQERVYQHKQGIVEGFTKRYGCYKLIYYEQYNNVNETIAREKQIKNWRREKKENIIKKMNPMWRDLSKDW